jgi:hypothetical protein
MARSRRGCGEYSKILNQVEDDDYVPLAIIPNLVRDLTHVNQVQDLWSATIIA